MRATLACFVVLAGIGAMGCGDGTTPGSVDAGVDGGGGHDGGPTADSGPHDGGGGDAGGVDGGGVDGGAIDGGSVIDAGTDAATTPIDAGDDAFVAPIDGGPGSCSSDTDCPAVGGTARFCMFPMGACGAPGTCTDTGGFCTGLFMPVCGCDGRTYSNAGCATQMGASIDYTGACTIATCGCARDRDCAATEECVTTPTGGRCETTMPRPACWRDADCAHGQTCMGANVCTCGASCLVADMPGTCG